MHAEFDLLIRHTTVLDPAPEALRILENQLVGIQHNRIVRLAADDGRHVQATQTLDGSNLLTMPGLINTHCHAAMVLFRGIAEDVSIDSWFNDIIWRLEHNLSPEDVYWGTKLAAIEMIEAGVTTVADHYFHMNAVATALAESGLRAHLAPTMFGSNPKAELDSSHAFFSDWHGAHGGRISGWFGPHSPYLCSDDFLEQVRHEAKETRLGIHLHVSETARQVEQSLEQHGRTPIQQLDHLGLLESPILLAHAAHAQPADFALMQNAGVAHCPKTFLKLAAGIAPIKQLLDLGVAVGVGSDGAASNNTLDMLEQIRLAALLQKHEQGDPTILRREQALRMASSEGARVLQEQHLGRIAEGYLADLSLIRLDGAHLQPLHDLPAALVYSARAADVDTVIVDGLILLQGRQHQKLDSREVMQQVRQRLPHLLKRSDEQLQSFPG